jgi:hypothetical protein
MELNSTYSLNNLTLPFCIFVVLELITLINHVLCISEVSNPCIFISWIINWLTFLLSKLCSLLLACHPFCFFDFVLVLWLWGHFFIQWPFSPMLGVRTTHIQLPSMQAQLFAWVGVLRNQIVEHINEELDNIILSHKLHIK